MSARPKCSSCEAQLSPGAKFCRQCGAAVEATRVDGGASVPTPTPTPPPPRRMAPPNPPPPPPPGVVSPPAQPGSSGRNGPLLALGAFLACLAIGGVAFGAVYLLSGDDSSPAGLTVEGGGVGTSTSELDVPPPVDAAGDEATAAATPIERGFPTDSRATMRLDTESLLREFHEAVVEGEFRYAWSLLTARKRQAEAQEKTFSGWKEAQATLSPYLIPEGIRAEIDGLEDDGVARVRVTGMGWTHPDSPCSEWSGLTWVRYEGGAWRYDPGYSTTAERRLRWQDRSAELLGVGC